MSKIGFWIKNARSISLPQSALPCLTAIVLSIGQDGFLWWLTLPILLGICAAHLGMNLADDYFDFKHDSRIRADINKDSVRARMEKCHYLIRGGDQENKYLDVLANDSEQSMKDTEREINEVAAIKQKYDRAYCKKKKK